MSFTQLELFILTLDDRSYDSRSDIVIYGISPSGPVQIICSFRPYFFVRAETPAALVASVLSGSSVIEDDLFTSLSGAIVKKLTHVSIPEAEAARERFTQRGIELFESDVKPRERFLMDAGINGGVVANGTFEFRNGMWRATEPTLTPSNVSITFKVCSLDIETSVTSGEILSIAAHTSGRSAEEPVVFMRGNDSTSTTQLVMVENERALLQTFEKWFQSSDPDLIIGWNVVGFDLKVMQRRAEALKISLLLGRDKRPFYVQEGSGRFSRAYVPGRMVLDGPQLLRSSFYSFESYSLENVSQSVLGEGKLLSGDHRGGDIERLFEEDKTALAAYNLKDTVLVTRIFSKLGLLELTTRRSELTGMLLDQVGRSVASFDHFYLPRLHRANYVAPNVGQVGELISSAGGYVISPNAGLYEEIASFDFQSLYPSIIRTFGIDPLSRAAADKDVITTPRGFSFSRTKSILPNFIGELMVERVTAKATNNRALSQAIKILMNSLYGVMGSPGSRLYHPALSDAITSTGQWLLTESVQWFEKRGDKVIYGDTDSLFVKFKDALAESGTRIAQELTAWWRQRLESEYKVTSYLKLEFKQQYKKFLVPQSRGNDGGAKKRYAGFSIDSAGQETIEFVGFEVVRSDSTKLAQDFQRELYGKVFRGEEIQEWIREFVRQVYAGAFNEKLVYRKRLHKNLDEYGSSPPPYVRAARLMQKPSREVKYIMTTEGPKPIELASAAFDYDHYVEKQLRPVADSILEVIGSSFKSILSKQLSLF